MEGLSCKLDVQIIEKNRKNQSMRKVMDVGDKRGMGRKEVKRDKSASVQYATSSRDSRGYSDASKNIFIRSYSRTRTITTIEHLWPSLIKDIIIQRCACLTKSIEGTGRSKWMPPGKDVLSGMAGSLISRRETGTISDKHCLVRNHCGFQRLFYYLEMGNRLRNYGNVIFHRSGSR